MFEVEIQAADALAALRNVVDNTRRPRDLMRAIAGTLESETEANFAAQGRPAWLGLHPATRAKRGADAQILQASGRLAASVLGDYGDDFARIGSNVAYAAIHQFGGQTAPHVIRPRNKKALAFNGRVVKKVNHPGSKIPARPFLPADKNGRLQPEAARAIDSDVQAWLRTITDPA